MACEAGVQTPGQAGSADAPGAGSAVRDGPARAEDRARMVCLRRQPQAVARSRSGGADRKDGNRGRDRAASRLSEVEVASALVRQARERAFTVEERDRALASLADDFATLIIVEFTPEITADARALLLRHRLRAADAVQLASCLYLQREMSQSLPSWRLTIGSRRRLAMRG